MENHSVYAVGSPSYVFCHTDLCGRDTERIASAGHAARSIAVAERLISGILDEVTAGMGYSDAKIKAHNTILDAVLANETDGYGFAILAAIANNAIFEYRDMYLRPEYYRQAEEQVRVLIADLIEQVKNGGDYE